MFWQFWIVLLHFMSMEIERQRCRFWRWCMLIYIFGMDRTEIRFSTSPLRPHQNGFSCNIVPFCFASYSIGQNSNIHTVTIKHNILNFTMHGQKTSVSRKDIHVLQHVSVLLIVVYGVKKTAQLCGRSFPPNKGWTKPMYSLSSLEFLILQFMLYSHYKSCLAKCPYVSALP